LTPDGNLFLIDFGIARHFKPGQARDTVAFGSPGYAAPEQYGKAQTTPRADIYSLGAILHQMISGQDPSLAPFRFPPLTGEDQMLQVLFSQMLKMDEAKRPQTAEIVQQRLQQSQQQPATPLPAPARAGPAGPATPASLHPPAFPGLPPHLAPVVVH